MCREKIQKEAKEYLTTSALSERTMVETIIDAMERKQVQWTGWADNFSSMHPKKSRYLNFLLIKKITMGKK